MGLKWCVLMTALVLQAIGAVHVPCPIDSNCICRHNPGLELNCDIDGKNVEISLMPETYLIIKCINTSTLNFDKLPKCANPNNTFKSVTFKNCPLPTRAFKDVLEKIGVSKTLALIFQNAKNLSGYFDRKHFTGLQNLTKLLISVKGLTQLPNDLFEDIDKLQWLNIKSNRLNLTQELFKPLGKLETLEISHNHMSNISSNLFSHLSLLKKLSLWQDNVTWFSKDTFTGADVLEELDLSSNGLDELPESIFKPLKRLRKLTLFSNKFSSLPRNLFQNNNQLDTVIMFNNDVELRKLPENLFGNLPSMRQVYLQRCGLEDVPYNLFKNSSFIIIISLAYNNIRKLPETIFNDQIHLQELDLSSNQLENLDPKLFSSLVCLHTLNLSFNSLVTISGDTFAPLLSLREFNIDHNNLRYITSDLFVNNRQSMSISMAYNKLNQFSKLDQSIDERGCPVGRGKSPFANVHSLKLLNLSHNAFTHTFKDWWENGHEVLDFSYNKISFLRDDKVEPKSYVFLKPIKEVRISNNQLQCTCINHGIIDFLKNQMNTKWTDLDGRNSVFHCRIWDRVSCDTRAHLTGFALSLPGLFILILAAYYCGCLQLIYHDIKKFIFYTLYRKPKNEPNEPNVIVEFTESDEEFVRKHFLPELRYFLGLRLDPDHSDFTCTETCKQIFLTTIPPASKIQATFVIFSAEYLTSHYRYVGINKIRAEMMKAENTIYVFIDNVADNLVYAFLMQQRDPNSMILWDDAELWTRIGDMLNTKHPKTSMLAENKDVIENLLTVTIVKSKIHPKLDAEDHPAKPSFEA